MLFGTQNKNPIKIADKGVVEWHYTTCGYCSTGCSIEVGLDHAASRRLPRRRRRRREPRQALHQGHLRARAVRDARARHTPLMRASALEPFREAGWDEALDRVAAEIQRIQASYGRDAFAIVSTGQIMTEEFYTLGKLARGVIGTNNYDGNTTLCMSSAVSGYKRSFGSRRPARLLRGLRAHRVPARLRVATCPSSTR